MTTIARPTENKSVLRWLSPRFSLRVLLVAVTAFAIGFPVWYRWPYEAEDLAFANKKTARSRYVWKRYTTWQRQWGGGILKHGPEREFVDGKLRSLTTYRHGVMHGPYAMYGQDGELRESGQYEDGKKNGTWRSYYDRGVEFTQSEWKQGWLWRLTSIAEDGRQREITFLAPDMPGRILFEGREVEDRLARLAAEGRIDNSRTKNALGSATSVQFVELPLRDGVDFLSSLHQIPIFLDENQVSAKQPLTDDWRGIPFSTALTVMTAPHDIACDYRYGFVWITSAEDVQDWHDPTGVADIVPPKDSQLARSWNEPVNINAIDQPLADAIAQLATRLAIAPDASRITPAKAGDPAYLVTLSVRHPFQHVLGILLYKTGCRCRLDGETLVILPK